MRIHVLTTVLAALLTGCDRDPYAINPSDYDNDLTEAAFRFLFDRFPDAPEEAVYCLVWGYTLAPVSEGFVARFADLKHDIVSYSAVKTEVVGTDVTFRLKGDTNAVAFPVAFFQVVHVAPEDLGKRTMEISWTCQNRSKRELVMIDDQRPGSERFSVVRDITWSPKMTEPVGTVNPSPPGG